MECNCNKKSGSKCASSKCDSCSCDFTGDITYDGLDFICHNDPDPDAPDDFVATNGSSLNAILTLIFTQICNLIGFVNTVDLNNVGAGVEVYKDRVGNVFNLRTLVAGTGTTITQLGDDEIEISCNCPSTGAVIVAYVTDALSLIIGITDTDVTNFTYTVPGSTGPALYELHCNVNNDHAPDTDCSWSAYKNGVEIDVLTRKRMNHVAGQGENPVLELSYFISQVSLDDGDVIDMKAIASGGGNTFNEGVFLLKKIT